ncbi:hypothetical protein PanWU01x14_227960 [Parasponia andersonii]|uniref:Uncharacterized protein n=1 Tax=Parasponia andersonii TaxID=3476 RepID=A0A2P5BLX8_PARAD|nr:hypothetical protein PanWU01x14_227960 [Parasponia andersonii]
MKYDLKMNPLNCAFGVTEGKFLSFVVDNEGIKIDQDKTKAILKIEPPNNLKQSGEFVGKISHLRRFEEIKHILINPRVMSAPLPNKKLLVYLTTFEEAIGTLIA